MIGLAAGGLALLAALAVGFALASGHGDRPDLNQVMRAAGCTLVTKQALPSVQSITTPTGSSPAWNTSPPTSGPHYSVPVVWGAYTQPVNMAQLVHNLAHGGIYILYGQKVPAATVAQLRSFYDDHARGTILAPLPSLGHQIALGAWTTRDAGDASRGRAHLATCTAFHDRAFNVFFRRLQFRGPERFPPNSLLPGRN